MSTPEPGAHPPPPAPPDLLAELTRLVRVVAYSADRDIAEVVAWMHANGI